MRVEDLVVCPYRGIDVTLQFDACNWASFRWWPKADDLDRVMGLRTCDEEVVLESEGGHDDVWLFLTPEGGRLDDAGDSFVYPVTRDEVSALIRLAENLANSGGTK